MFGFFKKPNATKSARECFDFWTSLSERDQKTIATNIEKSVHLLNSEASTATQALTKIGEYKQSVIKFYQIKSAQHPAFIQFQIISDYIFSHSQGNYEHTQCAGIFNVMINSLSDQSKMDILAVLDKYIGKISDKKLNQIEPANVTLSTSKPKESVLKKSLKTPSNKDLSISLVTSKNPTFLSSATADLHDAAKSGDAEAQFKLGVMYENGDGVEDNCIEAARWYKLASAQGYAKAQFSLGILYKSGIGVSKDLQMAQQLIQLAAVAGLAGASDEVRILKTLLSTS